MTPWRCRAVWTQPGTSPRSTTEPFPLPSRQLPRRLCTSGPPAAEALTRPAAATSRNSSGAARRMATPARPPDNRHGRRHGRAGGPVAPRRCRLTAMARGDAAAGLRTDGRTERQTGVGDWSLQPRPRRAGAALRAVSGHWGWGRGGSAPPPAGR